MLLKIIVMVKVLVALGQIKSNHKCFTHQKNGISAHLCLPSNQDQVDDDSYDIIVVNVIFHLVGIFLTNQGTDHLKTVPKIVLEKISQHTKL